MDRKEEILKAYNFRFACKEFDENKKISEDDFKFILETGRLSPSSLGLEPWMFVIVQDKKIREKMLPYCQGAKTQLPTASHFMIILARKADDLRDDSDYVNYILKDIKKLPEEVINSIKGFLKSFQENLVDNLRSDEGVFNWSCKQTYIAMGNMMTAAAEIGIDSCPIEGFDNDKIEEILVEEGILDKNHFKLSSMVAFGYRKEDNKYPKLRQPLDEITKWI